MEMVKSGDKEKEVRIPRQKRSLEKKVMIKKAALGLFSEKGYYNTTTNEIAKTAGVSIGTLYAYYKDKKDIYTELVRELYAGSVHSITAENIPSEMTVRDAVYIFAAHTMDAHAHYSAFQREVASLSMQSDEMRRIEQEAKGPIGESMISLFTPYIDIFRVKDLETAGFIIMAATEASAHEASFYENGPDKQAVVRELADMLCRYLFKPEHLDDPFIIQADGLPTQSAGDSRYPAWK